jgi:hypothetical protein
MSRQLGVRTSSHELLVQSSSDVFTSSHMYSTARLELRVLPPTTANYNIPTETGTVDQMREHASEFTKGEKGFEFKSLKGCIAPQSIAEGYGPLCRIK